MVRIIRAQLADACASIAAIAAARLSVENVGVRTLSERTSGLDAD